MFAGIAVAQPSKYGLIGIARIQPFKSRRNAIMPMQRRISTVEMIEVVNQRLNAAMIRCVEQFPRQRGIVIPFVRLRKFLTHKQ